jgi:peptide/nickel transport system permease protein
MLGYILKRLLTIPIFLMVLTILTFALTMGISPYERLGVLLPTEDWNTGLSLDDLVERYGLDRPFLVQYWDWLAGVLHGNLGWSTSARMPVGEALLKYAPASIELTLLAQVLMIVGAVGVGTYVATKHNRLPDQIARVLGTMGVAIPGFVIALFLLVVFYGWLGVFAPGRLCPWARDVVASAEFIQYTGMNTLDGLLNGRLDVSINAMKHLILPSIAMCTAMLSGMMRVMRSSMLETLRQDYVTTARSKGLKERVVVLRHAQRNALLPVVTMLTTSLARVLTGTVIIESIFNYRGMGKFAMDAARALDFPAVLGVVLVMSTIIVFSTIVVDLLYMILDPRVVID